MLLDDLLAFISLLPLEVVLWLFEIGGDGGDVVDGVFAVGLVHVTLEVLLVLALIFEVTGDALHEVDDIDKT